MLIIKLFIVIQSEAKNLNASTFLLSVYAFRFFTTLRFVLNDKRKNYTNTCPAPSFNIALGTAA